jgi:hypothetical protein
MASCVFLLSISDIEVGASIQLNSSLMFIMAVHAHFCKFGVHFQENALFMIANQSPTSFFCYEGLILHCCNRSSMRCFYVCPVLLEVYNVWVFLVVAVKKLMDWGYVSYLDFFC